MKTSIRRVSLVLAAALGCHAAWAQTVMRISHPLPPGHHVAQMVDRFAAQVETGSGGKVDVQIFGADQAFKANQNHAAVARRQIEAALVTNFQWGGTIPEMNVTSIPYYMTRLEQIRRFPGSPAARLLESKLEQKGVKNLAWLYTTRQGIFTSNQKPLVQIDDFKGVKIRGLSKLVDEGLAAAGAAPATMNAAEVYQALQSGVLDAGLTDVSAAYSRRFYEVQKFGTVSPFFTVYFHLFVNPEWWNGLDADTRKVIEQAAAKAEKDAIEVTEETARRAMTQLRDNNMALTVHTPEQAAAFRKVMSPPVVDAFVKSSPDARKLLEMVDQLDAGK